MGRLKARPRPLLFVNIVTVGAYHSTRLSNIGIGHGAFDGGFGYTYFDPVKGHEFSAVAGLTYNFMNPSTDYQSGVDFHLDWGASQFLSKQIFVGLVGYLYNEVGCDSGSGDRVAASSRASLVLAHRSDTSFLSGACRDT